MRKLSDQDREREERFKKSRSDVIHLEGVVRQAWDIFAIHRNTRVSTVHAMPAQTDLTNGLCLLDVSEKRSHEGVDQEHASRAISGPAFRADRGGDDSSACGGRWLQGAGGRHRGRAGKEKAGVRGDGRPNLAQTKTSGECEGGEIGGGQRVPLGDSSPTGARSAEICGVLLPENEFEQATLGRVLRHGIANIASGAAGERGRVIGTQSGGAGHELILADSCRSPLR